MPARIHKGHFTKVKVARQLLREKAEEMINQYLQIITDAQAAGDFETASKAMQWLIEHAPEDEDGDRMIAGGIDKQKFEQKPTGPQVQIGIQLGGVGHQKALPAPVVTSEPVDE